MKQRLAPPLSSLNEAPVMPFRRALLIALGVMTLSGILLIGGFLAYHLNGFTYSEVQPKVWPGNSLQLAAGKGAGMGEALEIRALSSSGQVIISSGRIALAAEKYPFLEYQLEGLHPEMDPVFFWRSAAEPEKVVSVPLPWNGREKTLIRLGHHHAWQGIVVEFGIGFHKHLPEPVAIRSLAFQPVSAATLLAVVWSDWTTFEGWSQRSINFLGNGANNLAPPVLAAAAWIGLGLVLYGLGRVFQYWYWDGRVVGIAFLLGWVAVDIQWQAGLWQQLQKTYERYGGRGGEEKFLAAEDRVLFNSITEIKAHLPPIPQRVFLVAAGPLKEDHYIRLRARYHLLPYNVHDYGPHLPAQDHVRAGDYVLILGRVPDFTFDTDQQLLRENKQNTKELAAEKVHAAALGTLYKLL